MSHQIATNKMHINDLKVGMYICRLEIPWVKTDYPVQGFFIESDKDIEDLWKHCNYVYVDFKRNLTHKLLPKSLTDLFQKETELPIKWQKSFCGSTYEKHSGNFSNELRSMTPLMMGVEKILRDVKPDLSKLNATHLTEFSTISESIIGSAIRNPDALLWLSAIKSKNSEIYDHCVRCAIWAILLARHLGVREDYMVILCQSLLLTSIGKANLSIEELHSFNPEDTKSQFYGYIPTTLTRLMHASTLNPRVKTIMRNMAERYDGSGILGGCNGTKVPFLAQIASLAETYELLVRPFNRKKALASVGALTYLFDKRDQMFSGSIIEAFIQAIGIYPPGSFVALSNGCEAVVVEQAHEQHVRSVVAVLKDANGTEFKKPQIVDLADEKFEEISIEKELTNCDLTDELLEQVNLLLLNKQKKWSLF